MLSSKLYHPLDSRVLANSRWQHPNEAFFLEQNAAANLEFASISDKARKVLEIIDQYVGHFGPAYKHRMSMQIAMLTSIKEEPSTFISGLEKTNIDYENTKDITLGNLKVNRLAGLREGTNLPDLEEAFLSLFNEIDSRRYASFQADSILNDMHAKQRLDSVKKLFEELGQGQAFYDFIASYDSYLSESSAENKDKFVTKLKALKKLRELYWKVDSKRINSSKMQGDLDKLFTGLEMIFEISSNPRRAIEDFTAKARASGYFGDSIQANANELRISFQRYREAAVEKSLEPSPDLSENLEKLCWHLEKIKAGMLWEAYVNYQVPSYN